MNDFFQNLQNHGCKKGNCKLLFIRMQVHHTEKMKQLVYPPPNIVHCL